MLTGLNLIYAICEIFSILIISTLCLKMLKLVQLKPINHYYHRNGYNNFTRCVLQRLKVS